MTRSLEIDPAARAARVEPGIVLDDLRNDAERDGLTFGPDPATHAWCTVGGMIGNNACGSHALCAGKTVDIVERLTVALYGGDLIDAGPVDPDGLGDIADSVLARIAAELRELRDEYIDAHGAHRRCARRGLGSRRLQLRPAIGGDLGHSPITLTALVCPAITQRG